MNINIYENTFLVEVIRTHTSVKGNDTYRQPSVLNLSKETFALLHKLTTGAVEKFDIDVDGIIETFLDGKKMNVDYIDEKWNIIIDSWQLTVDNGQLTMDSWQWTMNNGQFRDYSFSC